MFIINSDSKMLVIWGEIGSKLDHKFWLYNIIIAICARIWQWICKQSYASRLVAKTEQSLLELNSALNLPSRLCRILFGFCCWHSMSNNFSYFWQQFADNVRWYKLCVQFVTFLQSKINSNCFVQRFCSKSISFAIREFDYLFQKKNYEKKKKKTGIKLGISSIPISYLTNLVSSC